MLTIKSINSNPIFAPLGHEEDFKRRLFLDNFNKCMTIRQFEKTAGLEIKKKLTETPTAKAMKELINDIGEYWPETTTIISCLPTLQSMIRFTPISRKLHMNINIFNQGFRDYEILAQLYTTKSSNYQKIVNSKFRKYQFAHRFYDNIIHQYTWNHDHLKDKLLRIGFWNFFMKIVKRFIKEDKLDNDFNSQQRLGSLIEQWDFL